MPNAEVLRASDRNDKVDNDKFRWNDAIDKTKDWANVTAAMFYSEMYIMEVLQWTFTTRSRRWGLTREISVMI